MTGYLVKSRLLLAALLAVVTVPCSTAKRLPANLAMWSLTRNEVREADALAHYGWAVYQAQETHAGLALDPDRCLAALLADPSSEFLLQELLKSLDGFSTDERAAYLMAHLLPVARRTPQASGMRMVLAQIFLRAGRGDRAWELLASLIQRRQAYDPRLIRQALRCLRAEDELRLAQRMIHAAAKIATVRDSFAFQQAIARHYHLLSGRQDHSEARRERNAARATAAATKAVAYVEQSSSYANILSLVPILLEADRREMTLPLFDSLESRGLSQFGSRRMHAQCLESLNRDRQALGIWELLAQDQPYHADVQLRVGKLAQQLGKANRAIQAYELAYRLAPSEKLALRIGWLHAQTQSRASAFRYADKAGHSPARFRLEAHIYHQSGELAPAIQALEKALTLNKNDPQTTNFLGYLLADCNQQLDRALALIQTALRAAPERPAYRDSYAWVLYRLQRFEEAQVEIQRARDGLPDDPVVHSHAAAIQAALEQQVNQRTNQPHAN